MGNAVTTHVDQVNVLEMGGDVCFAGACVLYLLVQNQAEESLLLLGWGKAPRLTFLFTERKTSE